jgi:hypothetical protein
MNKMGYSQFNNQKVIITTRKGSKYFGRMITKESDKERFLLKNLCILHKDGTTKAMSGVPQSRFFRKDNIIEIRKED